MKLSNPVLGSFSADFIKEYDDSIILVQSSNPKEYYLIQKLNDSQEKWSSVNESILRKCLSNDLCDETREFTPTILSDKKSKCSYLLLSESYQLENEVGADTIVNQLLLVQNQMMSAPRPQLWRQTMLSYLFMK